MNQNEELELLRRAIIREKLAKKEAESLLESKTLELWTINTKLEAMHNDLMVHQRQLVSTEKLVALGQLSAGIMHEVNNPLAFVISNFGTLKEYNESYLCLAEWMNNYLKNNNMDQLKDSESLKKIADEDWDFLISDTRSIFVEVKDGLDRIKDIVSNLKDFTRTKPSDREEIDVNNVVNNSLKIIHNKLKYNFDVKVCYGNIPNIHGNKNELSQVILNLVINATQAVENKRGKIEINTQFDGKDVQISVADNGKGIKPDVIERIFNPFFTDKPVGEGTGLGLSVSLKIIHELGGDINVESQLGVGTRFIVIIPLDQRKDSRAPERYRRLKQADGLED